MCFCYSYTVQFGVEACLVSYKLLCRGQPPPGEKASAAWSSDHLSSLLYCRCGECVELRPTLSPPYVLMGENNRVSIYMIRIRRPSLSGIRYIYIFPAEKAVEDTERLLWNLPGHKTRLCMAVRVEFLSWPHLVEGARCPHLTGGLLSPRVGLDLAGIETPMPR
jgi:hypothetical protein